MIDIRCHTNLDLPNEFWPDSLPAIPRVGDLIESKTQWGRFRLRLQVVSVTWSAVRSYPHDIIMWRPTIELHMTEFQRKLGTPNGGYIDSFHEWYNEARSQS